VLKVNVLHWKKMSYFACLPSPIVVKLVWNDSGIIILIAHVLVMPWK